MSAAQITERPVRRHPERGAAQDWVLIEEPLEIRVLGDTVAVTMRTPGHDRQLATGFLFAEGLIRSAQDLGAIAHCGRPGDEGYGNRIEITPAPGVRWDPDAILLARRGTITSSACGVCGRRSIDDLRASIGPPIQGAGISATLLARAPDLLREAQLAFRSTGGSHAAAAIDADGAMLAAFEDVGRHNAVDKVIGALVISGELHQARLLVVSGRASFEILQKAAMARIPVVASVSAASSLAIDLAREAGITLASFVRDGAFNLYTHDTRVTGGRTG